MTPAQEENYIVALTERELDRFLDALDEVQYMIAHARSICDAVYAMVSQDQVIMDEMTGFLNMAAKGFRAAEDKEGVALQDLGSRFRHLKAAIIDMRAVNASPAARSSASDEGGNHDH